jgi:hypothetical protein
MQAYFTLFLLALYRGHVLDLNPKLLSRRPRVCYTSAGWRPRVRPRVWPRLLPLVQITTWQVLGSNIGRH